MAYDNILTKNGVNKNTFGPNHFADEKNTIALPYAHCTFSHSNGF